jgi:hypothetical protein
MAALFRVVFGVELSKGDFWRGLWRASRSGRTNADLPANAPVQVSLRSGPQPSSLVVPLVHLYGLATSLKRARALGGLDQSKIPFSQRKPVFSVRFLVVGVPSHGGCLTDWCANFLHACLNANQADDEVVCSRNLRLSALVGGMYWREIPCLSMRRPCPSQY